MKVIPIDCIERHILGFLEGGISEKDPFYVPPYTYFQGRNLDRENYVYLVACEDDHYERKGGFSSAVKTYFREESGLMRKVLIDRLVMAPEAPAQDVFEGILNILTEFAADLVMEACIFSEIEEPLFFPTTLSKEGSYIPPQYKPLFEEFYPAKTQYCYTLPAFHTQSTPDIQMRPMDARDHEDRFLYKKLWAPSRYNLFQTFDISTYYLHAWNISTNLLMAEDSILFAEEKGKVVGFVEWKPNLHAVMKGTPSTYFVSEEKAKEVLKTVDEAKICKVVTEEGREDLFKEMIVSTLHLLSTKYSITKYQIGNIDDDDALLRKVIEKMGKKIATITYVRRTP